MAQTPEQPPSEGLPASPWVLVDDNTIGQTAGLLETLTDWLLTAPPLHTNSLAHALSRAEADHEEITHWVDALAARLRRSGRAMTTTSTLAVIYECNDCGERSIDRRCPDCNLFSRRLGTGGNCPNCDEPVLVEELFNPTHQAPSHTENLTGPCRSESWNDHCTRADSRRRRNALDEGPRPCHS